MLYLGTWNKVAIIRDKLKELGLSKLAIVGEAIDELPEYEIRYVSWKESIMYREYYPMLQFVANDTLFVWNEALRSRKRHCLEYNCIRRYAQQTQHRLLFQRLPLIEEKEDALILADIASQNPFLRLPWEDASFGDVCVAKDSLPTIRVVPVAISEQERARYRKIKADAIAAVKRDPSIIPRRCLKYAEKVAQKVCPECIFTSKEHLLPEMTISLTDLPVDSWYYDKLCLALGGVEDVFEKISGH